LDPPKYPEIGPFISIEVILILTAMMTTSLDFKLHPSLLVDSTLGAMHAMNGEIAVFLARLEFEGSSLGRVLDRH
jgi:hypothetical protein